MRKKQLAPDEIFLRKKKLAKAIGDFAPYFFIVLLIISLLCLVFAIQNSFGNIGEIIKLLNSKAYTGEQLRENYQYLINKYGEWVIGNGNAGFQISFVNIGKALFGGLAIANFSFFIIFFVSAFVLGKWLLPKLSKHIDDNAENMVSLTILRKENKENKE